MKKIYQNPETVIVNVIVENLLTSGSNTITFEGDSGTAEINTGTASGAALSRRGSLWDEEE